jgi:hypothetical protein
MGPLAGLAVSAGIGVVSAGVGELLSKGKRKEAEALMASAAAEYDIPLPQLQQMVAEQLGPSAMEGVSTDPRLRDAQMQAFDALGQIQDSGGLTLADEAALERINNETARREAAGRNAIKNDMAARGTLGSGAELAMALNNQQQAAQRSYEAGRDRAAAAQARAWDAILAKSDMAGKMRSQDWGEKSQVAQAKDLIARYNANARTDAFKYNNDARQNQFDNRFRLADARSQMKMGQAGYKLKQADATKKLVGGIGQTANSAFDRYQQANVGGTGGQSAPGYGTQQSAVKATTVKRQPASGYGDYYDEEEDDDKPRYA